MSYHISLKHMIGQLVNIPDLHVDGRVISVTYDGAGVRYCVSYLFNGDQKNGWFYEEDLGTRTVR